MTLTKETILAAVEADRASLKAAWDACDLSKDPLVHPKAEEGWQIWEWCLRQLKAKGLPDDHAKALQQVYIGKARHMGTFNAIIECLQGETPTLIIG